MINRRVAACIVLAMALGLVAAQGDAPIRAGSSVRIVHADSPPTDTPVPSSDTPTATETPTREAGTLPTDSPTPTVTPVPPSNTPTQAAATAAATPTSTPPPSPRPSSTQGRQSHPRAPAGALRVDVLPSLVQPGGSARVVVSYVKDALVQVNVHLPQQQPFWLSGTTDSHGHLTLAFRVPRHVPLRHGHAVVALDVRAMAGPWHSIAALSTAVRSGATRHINVSYTPQTPVRALVTFPGARPLRLVGVTDNRG